MPNRLPSPEVWRISFEQQWHFQMAARPLPAIGAVLQQENVAPGDFADIGYALTPLRLAQGYLDVGS